MPVPQLLVFSELPIMMGGTPRISHRVNSGRTAEKFSTRSPAAAGTFATTWTTQPTLNSNPVMWFAFNAFGGADKWIAQPGS